MPSRFRGPLVAAVTAAPAIEGIPAELIARYAGRTKVIYNSFTTAADVSTATPITLNRVAINAGVPTLTVISGSTTNPYGLIPAAELSAGANATGAQWVQGAAGQGFGASLAGGIARNYAPPLVVTFASELAAPAAAINGAVLGIGLLDTNAATLDNVGAPAAAQGAYFRIPQGAAGVSGGITCVIGTDIEYTPAPAVRLSALVPRRFAIRMVIKRATAAADPLFTADEDGRVDFFIDDVRYASHFFSISNLGVIPIDVGPGVVSVRINGSTAGTRIPYWLHTIGPMRAGATTI